MRQTSIDTTSFNKNRQDKMPKLISVEHALLLNKKVCNNVCNKVMCVLYQHTF